MNYKEEIPEVQQSLGSYATGLAVVMSIIIGDGFAMIAVAVMFDIITRFGLDVLIVGMMVIGGLVSVIPNLAIVFRGSAFFVKMNFANCIIQILISFVWILTGFHELMLINVFAFLIPVVCIVLIRSEPYKRFVAFYYQLHVEREEYRKAMKAAVNKK